MIILILIWAIAIGIGLIIEAIFGVSPVTGTLWGFGIELMLFLSIAAIFYFTTWGQLRLRANHIAELRKKRLLKENLETWNRENRKFIKKMDKETEREIEKKYGPNPPQDKEMETAVAITTAIQGYNQGM